MHSRLPSGHGAIICVSLVEYIGVSILVYCYFRYWVFAGSTLSHNLNNYGLMSIGPSSVANSIYISIRMQQFLFTKSPMGVCKMAILLFSITVTLCIGMTHLRSCRSIFGFGNFVRGFWILNVQQIGFSTKHYVYGHFEFFEIAFRENNYSLWSSLLYFSNYQIFSSLSIRTAYSI